MNRLWLLWDSSVGKKVIMAVTGLVMVAYLVTHVLANLLVFQGPANINAYSAFLHGTGGALWAARAVLLAALVLHVIAAVQLAGRRYEARPVGYAGGRAPQVSTWASRSIPRVAIQTSAAKRSTPEPNHSAARQRFSPARRSKPQPARRATASANQIRNFSG